MSAADQPGREHAGRARRMIAGVPAAASRLNPRPLRASPAARHARPPASPPPPRPALPLLPPRANGRRGPGGYPRPAGHHEMGRLNSEPLRLSQPRHPSGVLEWASLCTVYPSYPAEIFAARGPDRRRRRRKGVFWNQFFFSEVPITSKKILLFYSIK